MAVVESSGEGERTDVRHTEAERREDQFREMDDEWEAVLDRQADLTRQRIAHKVKSWRDDMCEITKHYDKLVEEGKWICGPADLLGIVQVVRDEMVHTRMLAWLLDPRGRHRLADAVLRRLLEHVTDRAASVSYAVRHVQVSDWVNNRETDIVVYGRDFTLVIEVKVDADEQLRQCEDQYQNYRRKAPGALFLFLTPDGRRPGSVCSNEAKQAFKTASWSQIRAMITEAIDSRSQFLSGPGTEVAANYAITLREQFE